MALERRGKLDTLITQNVDGLHIKAGRLARARIQIHGHTWKWCAWNAASARPWSGHWLACGPARMIRPVGACGGILKAATISFGQALVADDLMRAQTAARHCDLMLAVGSTLSVFPIAGVVPVAKEAGARVVIVNAEPTAMDDVADAVLRGPISAILPRLVEA